MKQEKNQQVENSKLSSEGQVSEFLPARLQNLWLSIQRKYYPLGFDLMTFKPNNSNTNYWKLYLEKTKYQTPFPAEERNLLVVSDSVRFDFIGNEDLYLLFREHHNLPASFWDSFKQEILPKGFFIPITELRRLREKQVIGFPALLYQHTNIFSFHLFTRDLKEEYDRDHLRVQEVPLPILALWYHFRYFALVMMSIRTNYRILYHEIQDLLSNQLDDNNMNEKLLIAQVWTLMMIAIVENNSEAEQMKKQKEVLSKVAPSIQYFWGRFGPSINHYCAHGFEMLVKSKWPKSISKDRRKLESEKSIKQAFFNLYSEELEICMVQELIDNQSGQGFLKNNSPVFQEKYDVNQKTSFGDKMKKALGGASIMDRIRAAAEKEIEAPRPHFTSQNKSWIEVGNRKWYDLSKEERMALMDDFHSQAKPIYIDLETIAKQRYQTYLQRFANSIMAPFFTWKMIEKKLYPQWNILSTEKENRLIEAYNVARELERKEGKRLSVYLKKLPTLFAIKNVEAFEMTTERFTVPDYQKQWGEALETYKISILNKTNYRIRRMQEFGILEADELYSSRKEIWLDEILQIEKEVTPYIAFVKRVFQSALPIRKTVEFDPYRHSIDGVEFDPETTQDTQKWMHGEVMKTLRTKVTKSDAEQINAFALDSSGSMKGEKMRNLFKMIYLLVLGLEDRKTYDAFHFFGTDFIETANFTDHYTDRTLLFKILRKISVIYDNEVLYGGYGGTNISGGIFECYDRIEVFSKKLKIENPEIDHLKSIFVITDGEPSIGIINVDELNEAIVEKRKKGNIAIKGIYLKPEGEESTFMEEIFGKQQFVESSDFNDALNQFVYIMSLTYKLQRKELKIQRKKNKGKKTKT